MQAISWESLNKLQHQFSQQAINICNKGEDVSPQIFILELAQGTGKHKMVALDGELVHSFFNSDEGKEALSEFLKNMLEPGTKLRHSFETQTGFSPSVIVQINEAWVSMATSTRGLAGPDGNLIRPSLDPQRKECIMVLLHTARGSIPTVHIIESEPVRHCVRGEFPGPESLQNSMGLFAVQDTNG